MTIHNVALAAMPVLFALCAACASGGGGASGSASDGGTMPTTGGAGTCRYTSYTLNICVSGMTAAAYADAKTRAEAQTKQCPTCQVTRSSCSDTAPCTEQQTFLGRCSASTGEIQYFSSSAKEADKIATDKATVQGACKTGWSDTF